MADVVIPEDLWEEDIEGTLLGWLYEDGATVPEGEAIVEIMVEKVQHELCAPATGILTQLVAEDEQVVKGQAVGRVE